MHTAPADWIDWRDETPGRVKREPVSVQARGGALRRGGGPVCGSPGGNAGRGTRTSVLGPVAQSTIDTAAGIGSIIAAVSSVRSRVARSTRGCSCSCPWSDSSTAARCSGAPWCSPDSCSAARCWCARPCASADAGVASTTAASAAQSRRFGIDRTFTRPNLAAGRFRCEKKAQSARAGEASSREARRHRARTLARKSGASSSASADHT